MKTYCIDIDDTICTNGTCNSCKYEGSRPIKENIEKINKLYDDGHYIKYFTARGMGTYNDPNLAKAKWEDLTKLQLDIWGCKYHELIMGKPSADYYIDDKAINSDDFFN
jgi:radical SAM superfamily enzyme